MIGSNSSRGARPAPRRWREARRKACFSRRRCKGRPTKSGCRQVRGIWPRAARAPQACRPTSQTAEGAIAVAMRVSIRQDASRAALPHACPALRSRCSDRIMSRLALATLVPHASRARNSDGRARFCWPGSGSNPASACTAPATAPNAGAQTASKPPRTRAAPGPGRDGLLAHIAPEEGPPATPAGEAPNPGANSILSVV